MSQLGFSKEFGKQNSGQLLNSQDHVLFGFVLPIDHLLLWDRGDEWNKRGEGIVCGGRTLWDGSLRTAGPLVRVSPLSEAEISARCKSRAINDLALKTTV